jgi:hypothetical protein
MAATRAREGCCAQAGAAEQSNGSPVRPEVQLAAPAARLAVALLRKPELHSLPPSFLLPLTFSSPFLPPHLLRHGPGGAPGLHHNLEGLRYKRGTARYRCSRGGAIPLQSSLQLVAARLLRDGAGRGNRTATAGSAGA